MGRGEEGLRSSAKQGSSVTAAVAGWARGRFILLGIWEQLRR